MGTSKTSTLAYFVDHMDCASCVKKIEKAASRLPGTTIKKTNFTTQTLEIELDETQTSRGTLEHNLKTLGYTPHLKAENGQATASPQAIAENPVWHQTVQGKLILTSGVLLIAAYLLGHLLPEFARVFYIGATLIGVWPLLKKAFASARQGDFFSINTLVGLAALGSLCIGAEAEGALVVFLFLIGELLEGVAAGKARQSIKALTQLTPKTATILKGQSLREIPVEHLLPGHTVQVGPGSRIPADGTLLSGEGSVDESPITGESVPVHKTPGDPVYAGSINLDSVVTVRVEKAFADNTISKIIHLVEEAELSKAPTARFIDRFSQQYTPLVVLVSLLTVLVPPLFFGGNWQDWIYKGISLLLIGCPCALVLSTPAAITSGIASGARRGLLIKGGLALEQLAGVKTVAFDKTGTLTENKPRVTDLVVLQGTEAEALRVAATVEQGSHHPLARAIVERAGQEVFPGMTAAKALAGKGASAFFDGATHMVASPRHAATLTDLSAHQGQIEQLEAQGKTVVVVLREEVALALIAIRDEARPDAKQAIAELQSLGVKSVMLTGDNRRTGKAIAEGLGLDVQAELLPEDKLRLIREHRQHGKLAMVGDGINDAPALAEATVGIAMGGGTDVALETADAALLTGQVSGVPQLIRLSRRTMANIKQNIVFALGLKLVFLVTTLLGYTGLWLAILADTGATLIVTANALRLLRH